jgi:hypothetical protein
LNKSTKRIFHYDFKAEEAVGQNFTHLVAACDDEIRLGQKEALMEALDKLRVRPNIRKKALEYADKWENTSNIIINEEVTIMGDQYFAGQVGAQGPGAHAEHMEFNQIWKQVETSVELKSLAKELEKLREQMRKAAKDAGQDISIGYIAQAEDSAKKGDGPTTIQYLAKAGKWAFNIATNIGTTIAAAALKAALGI